MGLFGKKSSGHVIRKTTRKFTYADPSKQITLEETDEAQGQGVEADSQITTESSFDNLIRGALPQPAPPPQALKDHSSNAVPELERLQPNRVNGRK